MSKRKIFVRIALFFCVFLVIFFSFNTLMQPIWRDWNNYNTIYGFYEQPKNTIEVVFLGSSTTVNGYIPMQLYENYGICAYNLGTEQQPMLASYYWLEETYRLHSDSLKAVVINPSMLRRVPTDSFYRKALDGMRFSSIKFNAIKDYVDDPREIPSYLLSLLSYHDRWSSLEQEDFEKNGYEPATYTKGYNFITSQHLDSVSYNNLEISPYYIDETADGKKLNKEAAYYLDKMIDFCEEHSLKMIWIQTPDHNWSSAWHNAVADVMEEKGLDFFDFDFLPYFDEIDYNFALDNMDRWHENYSGASKITNWIGEYLATKCDIPDIRGDEKYAFMEDELKAYHANIRDVAAIRTASDPAEYLSTASQIPKCVVFVAVKDEAAYSLTKEQRASFEEIGLTALSTLTYRDSYFAVLDEGNVVIEQTDKWTDGEEKRDAISFSGEFGKGNQYTITSGGFAFGNTASILINGEEKAQDERGINIVVYNYETGEVIDSAVFDTLSSPERVIDLSAKLAEELAQGTSYDKLNDDLKKLYLYNRACDNTRTAAYLDYAIGESDVSDFLAAYWGKEGYTILISMWDDQAASYDASFRTALTSVGLTGFAEVETGDFYAAAVESGTVVFEQRGQGEEPLTLDAANYNILCGGKDSKNSIKVKGTEYASARRGMNVVVYDQQLKKVVYQAAYDMNTSAVLKS